MPLACKLTLLMFREFSEQTNRARASALDTFSQHCNANVGQKHPRFGKFKVNVCGKSMGLLTDDFHILVLVRFAVDSSVGNNVV